MKSARTVEALCARQKRQRVAQLAAAPLTYRHVPSFQSSGHEDACAGPPSPLHGRKNFAFQIAGEAVRLVTTLGGLDCLVFTAGIGEHQPSVRAAVCKRLAWISVELDSEANAANARVISSVSSRVPVLVVATDEEQVIADETISILHGEGATA